MNKMVVMKVIPHAEQRYDTLGDYWMDPDGTWQIRVSDMGDWRYNFSVLLHEFIEFALITQHEVSEKSVCDFDLAVPAESKYADDPGFDPAAPYHEEHVFSDAVERLIAPHLGMRIEDAWIAADKLPKWTPPA